MNQAPQSSEQRLYKVPALFWLDHADRCPCDNPETDMADEISIQNRIAFIMANEKQIETLRSDAAYYCDRWGPDECPLSIKRSAKATIDAISKAINNV